MVIESAIGSIITAVAVLDIHIDKNAVTSIIAKICKLGFLPAYNMVLSAIRLCNPHRSIAIEIKNPPKNKNISGCAYGAATLFIASISASGDITKGSKAVAGIGTTSLTHHDAIQNAKPAVLNAATDIPSGGFTRQVSNITLGPSNSQNHCILCFLGELFFKIC